MQGAQAFPDRPVKLVVSSPAGGPPDIMARLLSDKLAAALGQPIVVENKPGGGGGTVASKAVLAAEPDGYTIYMGSTSSVLIGPLVHKNAGFTAELLHRRGRAVGKRRDPRGASVGAGQLRRRAGQARQGATRAS